ncbi:lysophospholipid acyltransferase family protein [Botrimarina hoheduenensis]|uniref:1-acyl-sn-glycerol-3-phosphate acyltransferase n=1 Tax=Botrimarina hoheduenensis TaxID=2528000 RepID=A0A5C5WEG8_9BACT|nr:lysophospholipid acyltransferase family protein [Botrimarina hoheduenensis]TWT48445.1 1-acyl-sn-glycerol-3-phosphate acyltransferase [Botrimarina hoheduenensis]
MSPSVDKPLEPLPTYRRGLAKAVWYGMTSTAIWCVAKLVYRLRIEGQRRVPMEGPVVLVANHQSHLDPPLVGGATRRQLSYLARDTLFKGPLGWLIRSYDAVPVDRDGSGLAGLRATLKRLKLGGAVLVFPEGTRTPDGELQPLKPGFLTLVRRSKATLAPIGFDGPYHVWPRGAKAPRLTGRIAMHYGEPIGPAEVAELGDDDLLTLVRERIATAMVGAQALNRR